MSVPDCCPDPDADRYEECEVHVYCDETRCGALLAPESLAEWQAAAIHWRDHSVSYGCSHGS